MPKNPKVPKKQKNPKYANKSPKCKKNPKNAKTSQKCKNIPKMLKIPKNRKYVNSLKIRQLHEKT